MENSTTGNNGELVCFKNLNENERESKKKTRKNDGKISTKKKSHIINSKKLGNFFFFIKKVRKH